ncbi:unnamed protein product [Mytilus edulis]|uniref:Endonuclease/exonuclease/phosphatase domain-containing protein n=1 Tax=Mytilus edulis TaxID=6550 RepID=A0A8S3V691_MYTED|nr:unnamed protein product [Mytilus edulis]
MYIVILLSQWNNATILLQILIFSFILRVPVEQEEILDISGIQESDEVFDVTPLTYSPEFKEKYMPPPADWKFEWTEDLARKTCIQTFDNVTALETCRQFANLKTDDYIASCMTDIKETGGTTLLQGTILAMFSVCLSEVSRNETLLVTPSNNSTNGTSGSTETSGVVFKSMLDEIKASYARTTAVKKEFVITAVNNEKQSSHSPVIEKAEYKSFSAVSCPLPTSSERRRKRSISDKTADGYDISLSNDGTNFGDEATILIYDDECYSCNVTSVTCTLLSSCSLTTIETSSVSSDSVVITDSTAKTSPTSQPTNLLTTTTTPQTQSSASETTTKTVEPTEDSNDMIVIICGTVAGICLLVAIGFIVYCKCKQSNSTQNNFFPDFDGQNVAPYITHMQSKGEFKKETSSLANLDMQWLDNRPKTPEHLNSSFPFITNDKIALPEFETPIWKDRNSDGGGVIMYYKSNINIKRRLDLEHDILEIMWFELKTKLHVILINITYRSERFSPSNFLSLYDMMLKRALDETNHIICLGDLNKNFLLNLPNCISDILSINGIFNTISDATHFDSRTGSLSLLDPILITDSIHFIDSSIIPINKDIIDHEGTYITVRSGFSNTKSFKRTIWDYKRGDYNLMKQTVSEVEWNKSLDNDISIHESCNILTDEFLKVTESCIPKKSNY